jgi:hypothetical protein
VNPSVKVIWEPTHGNGAISNILITLGYTVIKTDMYPKTEDTIQFDFLNDTPTFYFDCIIFNPPFSNTTKFLEMAVKQCDNTSKQFIFICPLTVMETPSRSFIFNKHKLSIINLSKRVQYMRKSDTDKRSSVAFQSIWIINDDLGKYILKKLKKINDKLKYE